MEPPARDPYPDLKARLEAAIRLRDTTQKKLGEAFEADGLGKEDPGRIQRGDKAMQRAHLDAFCRHLRLPASYFTAADPFEAEQTQLDRIEAEVSRLAAAVETYGSTGPQRTPLTLEEIEGEVAGDFQQFERTVQRSGEEARQPGNPRGGRPPAR